MGRLRVLVGSLSLTIMLSACSIMQPIQQDQPLLLSKDQGVAAILMDALDPVTDVFLKPEDGGSTLDIPAVPIGMTLYIFQTQAGKYCLQQFYFGTIRFFGLPGKMTCFDVHAGQLGYSGNLAPRIINGKPVIEQTYNLNAFRALLKQQYPRIAQQFLSPPAAPLPVATPESANEPGGPGKIQKTRCNPHEQVCAWSEQVKSSSSQAIFLRNNTDWTVKINEFELYDCINIKQKCILTPSHIILKPHEAKQVLIVDPAESNGAYTYRYRYEYGFMLPGQH